MSARPYQTDGINQVRAMYKSGTKRVLLQVPTGGGKTFMFSHMMTECGHRGKRSVMAVRGRHLVDQASKRLIHEGVNHGVLMAGHWNYRPSAAIQICSIDTLLSWCGSGKIPWPVADFIVLDEVHFAISNGYHRLMAQYPEAFVLGVTATPWVDKSLRHVADAIVKPTSFKELIEQGFLLPPRYFAPENPDLSGVKVSASTKDYVTGDLAQAMQKGNLVGSVVDQWLAKGERRPTICFATNVEHSKNIVEQFNRAGVPAEHVEAETPEAERYKVLERVERGATKIVSNVGILCTGVDMPFISCIVMARPTKSYNLYIQQAGRGTRLCPERGKEDFILLDHAGNIIRHGFIDNEPDANLDGKPVDKGAKPPRTCSSCFAVFEGFRCHCGFEVPARERLVMELEGELTEIGELPFELKITQDIAWLKKEAKKRGFKRGWVFHRIVEKYGQEDAERFFKQRNLPAWMEFS